MSDSGDIVSAIKSAIPYSHDTDVRKALDELLRNHQNDLTDVGYTTDTRTIKAMKELEQILNDYDERAAAARAELAEAAAAGRELEEEEPA